MTVVQQLNKSRGYCLPRRLKILFLPRSFKKETHIRSSILQFVLADMLNHRIPTQEITTGERTSISVTEIDVLSPVVVSWVGIRHLKYDHNLFFWRMYRRPVFSMYYASQKDVNHLNPDGTSIWYHYWKKKKIYFNKSNFFFYASQKDVNHLYPDGTSIWCHYWKKTFLIYFNKTIFI